MQLNGWFKTNRMLNLQNRILGVLGPVIILLSSHSHMLLSANLNQVAVKPQSPDSPRRPRGFPAHGPSETEIAKS